MRTCRLTLPSLAGRSIIGAAILWAMLWITGQRMPRGRAMWNAYAIVGLLNGALPYTLIFWGATFVSTVTYIVPVNGLLLGALVLDEPLSSTLSLSLGLILTGVLLVRS